MQPEAKLVKKIAKEIHKEGGRSFKIHGQEEGVQEVGIPDLLVCLRSTFVGIEVKMPGRPLRPRQKLVLQEIYEAGGVAAIVESPNQARLLLSYLKERWNSEEGGILFNRGDIHHEWIKLR